MAETISDKARKEIERLRSEHPDYEENKSVWKFLLLAYEGGKKYVSSDNLFKHQREHWDDYNDRLVRATYANYCQPLVDFVPEFIYSQGVQRKAPKALSDVFDKFKQNVDRSGTALDPFMETVAEEARIFGHTWVGLDKVEKPSELANEEISDAKAEELGIKVPYFYHVRPLEVLDWVTDQFGNFLYIKRKEVYWEKKGAYDFRKIEKYTEWYKDMVHVSRIDITTPEEEKLLPKIKRPNTYSAIPFVQFFYKRSKFNKDLGVSFLNDIGYQNRQVFNLTSLIDEFAYRQCFNILAMEMNSALPTRDRTDGRIGTSNVLWVPREAKHLPQYISPASDPAQFIQSERSSVIKEMYRQAAQDIMAEVFAGGDVPSADAQKQAFARTIPMIAKMADMMQFGEGIMWNLWASMQQEKWAEESGVVAYRDDYSVTNVQDLLLSLSTIFNNLKVLTPTFIREEWKRVIREFDGKIDAKTLEEIHKEIDAISDQELVDGYKMQDVKAAPGMPSTANMLQGRAQKALGTDKKISQATGNKAATKEKTPDANRRVKKKAPDPDN